MEPIIFSSKLAIKSNPTIAELLIEGFSCKTEPIEHPPVKRSDLEKLKEAIRDPTTVDMAATYEYKHNCFYYFQHHVFERSIDIQTVAVMFKILMHESMYVQNKVLFT